MTKQKLTTASKSSRTVDPGSSVKLGSQSEAGSQIPADMWLIPVTQGQVGGVHGLIVDGKDTHPAPDVKRELTLQD